MNNDKTLASEIITDLKKHIILIDDRTESLYNDIRKIDAIFQAVHYVTAEGVISGENTDLAMSGIQTMINVLKDNAEEMLGLSDAIVQDITA